MYGYEDEAYAEGEEYQNYEDRRDDDHEWQYNASKVPEGVRSFLINFKKAINDGNLYEIQNAYDAFQKVSDKYYKNSSWPEVGEIKPIILKDKFFNILYKELYFRHIYAKIQGGPNLGQRFDSYANYCNLFNLILNTTTPVSIELPNQWLWEIIDEFIYQFQSFSLYRSKLKKTTDMERDQLKHNPNIWNVHGVLNVLHSLVDKSNINRQLEVYTSGGNPDSVAGEFGCHSLYKMLGYFSLVGLLRLHSLHGDYYQAIKVLENIELNKKSLYSRVPACQITTYYYVGFAYMMMRRYADAIRTFSNILLYIQRMKSMFQARTYQNDQINKQTEKMYKLLTICLVLHPQRIDESVHSYIKEKYGDHMLKMQHQDLKEFENCFSSSCPKFLSPVAPPPDAQDNFDKEPFTLQLKVFMEEVKQQINLPEIRSYLKLYTTMPNSKLGAFLNMSEDDYRNNILCFKHKMKNVVWTKGTSSLEGEFQSGSEVDFYIDKDMIHIADTKVAPRYGDFFIRQIHKFEEMSRTYKAPQA